LETKGVISNLGLGRSVAAMAARCAPSAPRGLAGKMVTAHLSDRRDFEIEEKQLTGVTVELAVFLAGTFVAACISGMAGFGYALIASAIWLHALPPILSAPLTVAYGLLVQVYAFGKLRGSFNYPRLMPFVVGSTLGVSAGVWLLAWASPTHLRIGTGVFLVIFSLYSLLRPALPQFHAASRLADAGIGVLNGILGGATALAGIIVVVWSGLRGWSKEEQRAVFQPTTFATYLMVALWLGGSGHFTLDIAEWTLLGLPALAAGTWLGWRLFGRLDEAAFRKIVLVLLLASGTALALLTR
jgi:uncharacterized protein